MSHGDDGFFELQKRRLKDFSNLLGVTKLIINEQDVAVRACKKVEYTPWKLHENKGSHEEDMKHTITKYKEIIFGSDTPSCMVCLDEPRKQQVIDQKIYDQKLLEDTERKLAWERLQKNIVMDGDTKIDKRTGEVWSPEVDSMYWKDKF